MAKQSPDLRPGLDLAEKLFLTYYVADLHVGYLVEALSSGSSIDQNVLYLQRGLEYLLLGLAEVLHATPEEGGSLSILLPREGRFRVLAQIGVRPGGIPIMESQFSYADGSIGGLVGFAVATRQVIHVADVHDPNEPAVRYWKTLYRNPGKTKSALCIPFDSRGGEMLGVLAISLPQAIDAPANMSLLNQFRAKFELQLLLARRIELDSISQGGPSLRDLELTHLINHRSTHRQPSQPPDFRAIASHLPPPRRTPPRGEAPATLLQRKADHADFDVFLAHNSLDKPLIEVLAQRLRERGIYPWLDTEQIPPGRWFQDLIQSAIPKVKSAAIFIGRHGLGKWESLELRAFIGRCVDDGIPVIPVRLPGVTSIPPEFVFLSQLTWVAFRTIDDAEALDLLEWGITDIHPTRKNKPPPP